MTEWTNIEAAESSLQVRRNGHDTWEVRWAGSDANALRRAIDDWTAASSAKRLIHYSQPRDYEALRLARAIGFSAEGFERHLENEQVTVRWRSSMIVGDGLGSAADMIDGSRPSHLVDEFHDVYGLPSLVSPDFEPRVDFERLGLRMSLIQEEFAELCGAIYGADSEALLLETFQQLPDNGDRDVVEAADALGDLTYVIYGMALEAGIDLDAVLAEVHRSNLSKLMPDGSVHRRPDGKVLKGPDFSPPDIAGSMRGK